MFTIMPPMFFEHVVHDRYTNRQPWWR